MDIWQILTIIGGSITAIAFLFMLVGLLLDDKKFKDREWLMLIGMLFIIPLLIYYVVEELSIYLSAVIKAGGFARYYRLKRFRELRNEVEKRHRKAANAEYERIKTAYLNGEIRREDLPRAEDGKVTFEFREEMGLYVDYLSEVREIVYVENGYCESLNKFFLDHKDLRLYHMYKFVYLPTFCAELKNDGMLSYLYPESPKGMDLNVDIDSNYPLDFLWHPEEAANIQHGMMFFTNIKDNHGSKYIKGHYFPLKEGADEYVIAQLDSIVKEVHSHYSTGGLYCKVKSPQIKEGSSEDYADEKFPNVIFDDEIAGIVEDVRKKLKQLREKGLAENLLLNLLKEKPKLSRLVITKDIRIFLPDYQNMEIKMEPMNKAVFLLFLRHPEGIVFKELPDYRKELAEIYQMIKPLGLNERVIQSIEDVTNPLLNSINEKCARIRGAFISQFDESLAQHYYIYGHRGQAKKIDLPRDLVTWE